MLRGESVFALLTAIFSGGYLFFSREIGFGSVNAPEAGFIPVILGAAGLVVSLLLFFGSLRAVAVKNIAAIPREGMRRFLACLAVSIAFIPVFAGLGTVVGIFLLVLSLAKILGASGWVRPIVLAAASAAVAQIVFVQLLEVPLPQGILDFGE